MDKVTNKETTASSALKGALGKASEETLVDFSTLVSCVFGNGVTKSALERAPATAFGGG